MANKDKSLSRRTFMKISAAGTAGLTMGNMILGPKTALGYVDKDQINPNIDNTRVVYIQDGAMTTGTDPSNTWSVQNSKTVDSVVAQNIDKMAKALAEETNTSNAWHKIFMKPSSKNWNEVVVAIKTNNIAEQHTRNAVMKKFCEVMVNEMGVTGSNIHIYDGTHGEDMTTETPFYNLPTGVNIENTWGGRTTYVTIPAPYSGTARCVQSIADGTADILINIAMCKGHTSSHGLFTMSMKNHFGTCDPHCDNTNYLIGINKSEAVLGAMDPGSGLITFPKQQLCFIDALWASQSGPGGYPSVRPNRFFMGTFPPVLDYIVAKKFRRDTMGWTLNETVTDRFLSDFGYTVSDLTNGGEMVDAETWISTYVENWNQYQ